MNNNRGLTVLGVDAGYGTIRVLRDVELTLASGECVAVLGANGAGKTTLLRAISGFARVFDGAITVDGRDINQMKPFQRVRRGIAQVPEGRRLFTSLSVTENLLVALHWRCLGHRAERRLLARAFDVFPRLYERRDQPAGSMSGGEQQMLTIARAIVLEPRYLLLDEPSTGLAPVLVDTVLDAVARLKDLGNMGLLVVEQNPVILEIADRGYILRSGRVVLEGLSHSLAVSDVVGRVYVGKMKSRPGNETARNGDRNSGNEIVPGEEKST